MIESRGPQTHPIIAHVSSRCSCFLICLACRASAQRTGVAVPGASVAGGDCGPELHAAPDGHGRNAAVYLVSDRRPASPGCKLHPHAGKIDCVPTTPGDFHFTIAVADASIPKLQVQRDLTIHVIAGLMIEWKDAPKVQGTTISGSAIVSNGTTEEFDLTVVIVAVNQIGRATALGYQHIKVGGQASSPVIPFGSAPGPGTYYVRADAVAHHSSHHRVYRASKQTTSTVTVAQQ